MSWRNCASMSLEPTVADESAEDGAGDSSDGCGSSKEEYPVGEEEKWRRNGSALSSEAAHRYVEGIDREDDSRRVAYLDRRRLERCMVSMVGVSQESVRLSPSPRVYHSPLCDWLIHRAPRWIDY